MTIPEREAIIANKKATGPQQATLTYQSVVIRAKLRLKGLFQFLAASPSPHKALQSPSMTRHTRWTIATFLLFVVVPSVSTTLYYAAIASPQYTAEAQLVVRTAEHSGTNDRLDLALASLGSSPFSSPSIQNAHIVAHYVRSRAIIDALHPLIDLREVFRRPEADFWARLSREATTEELVDYWQTMVRAYVDAPSGIVTIEARAFRPDDALHLANAIVYSSEKLINKISERARLDVMRSSEEEVRRANFDVRTALTDLQVARDTEGLIDPLKAADEKGKLLMQLLLEKVRTESDLFLSARSLSDSSPVIRQFKARLQILESQISTLQATLAGDSTYEQNLAGTMRRFESLEIQRQFAEKKLSFAEEALERARIKAERQNLYFMTFAPPSLPQKSLYPRRVSYSILIFIGLSIVWAIVALLFATIEDHRE